MHKENMFDDISFSIINVFTCYCKDNFIYFTDVYLIADKDPLYQNE